MTSKIIAFVFVLFVFQSITQSLSQKDCLVSEGITPEEANWFLDQYNLTEVSPKMKCLGTCMLERMNLIDGCNLKFEEDNHNTSFNMTMALDACKDSIKGSERCECGYQAFKCLEDFFNKPKHSK